MRPIRDVIPAGLAVPHMGWNASASPAGGLNPIFAALEEGHVYFVHSYAGFACGEAHRLDRVRRASDGGGAERKRVRHPVPPEKSGDVGLRILKAFCGLEGEA